MAVLAPPYVNPPAGECGDLDLAVWEGSHGRHLRGACRLRLVCSCGASLRCRGERSHVLDSSGDARRERGAGAARHQPWTTLREDEANRGRLARQRPPAIPRCDCRACSLGRSRHSTSSRSSCGSSSMFREAPIRPSARWPTRYSDQDIESLEPWHSCAGVLVASLSRGDLGDDRECLCLGCRCGRALHLRAGEPSPQARLAHRGEPARNAAGTRLRPTRPRDRLDLAGLARVRPLNIVGTGIVCQAPARRRAGPWVITAAVSCPSTRGPLALCHASRATGRTGPWRGSWPRTPTTAARPKRLSTSATAPKASNPAVAPRTPTAISHPMTEALTEVGKSSLVSAPAAGAKTDAASIASR